MVSVPNEQDNVSWLLLLIGERPRCSLHLVSLLTVGELHIKVTVSNKAAWVLHLTLRVIGRSLPCEFGDHRFLYGVFSENS